MVRSHGKAIDAYRHSFIVYFERRPEMHEVWGRIVQAAVLVDDLLVFHGLGLVGYCNFLIGELVGRKGNSKKLVVGFELRVSGSEFYCMYEFVRNLRVL